MTNALNYYPAHLLKGKVVLMNAPLLCGKDYSVEMLQKATGCQHLEFKKTLHTIAMAITGLPEAKYFSIYNDREKKEVPQKEFLGLSPRAMLIWISENVCKPKFGERYFGMPAAASVDLETGAAFSDSGFPQEIYPIADRLGAETVYVVRFNRGGADFSADSRDFLQKKDCPIGTNFIDMTNDATIFEFVNAITHWIATGEKGVFTEDLFTNSGV
jgi:hypothetical protein